MLTSCQRWMFSTGRQASGNDNVGYASWALTTPFTLWHTWWYLTQCLPLSLRHIDCAAVADRIQMCVKYCLRRFRTFFSFFFFELDIFWRVSNLLSFFSRFISNIQSHFELHSFFFIFLVHPINANYVLFVSLQLMCTAFSLCGSKHSAVSPVDLPILTRNYFIPLTSV